MKIGIRWLAFVTIFAIIVCSSGTTVIGQSDPTDVEVFGTYKVAADKQDPSKLSFIGAWRINLDKSAPGIRGRFTETATQTFVEENGGLRHSIYLFYPAKVDNYDTVFTPDARSYWFKLDGQNIYENPQGPNDRGQTAAMWLADRNTIYRERATKGEVDEWVLYRVLPGGNSMVWTPFNGNLERDNGQMYWDRITLP